MIKTAGMLLIAAIFFVQSSLAPLAAERVMMATPSHGLFEFPVVIAMKKGFFNDEGLDLRKVQMQPQLTVGIMAKKCWSIYKKVIW